MINKKELIGKHVLYIDKDSKQRIGKVVKITGNYLTVRNAVKTKYRIYKDRVIGRQFRKRRIREIKWK